MISTAPDVLMLGWELPPHNSGGLGVACYGLSKGLSRQGVNISFALPRRMTSRVPFMKILSHDLQGVEITAINSLLSGYSTPHQYREEFSTVTNQELQLYGESLYEEALRYGDLAARWAERQPHHIIHAHDWMTYPAAQKARSKSGKPWVAHIHATEYDRTNGQVDDRIAEIEYQGLNGADSVIAVSHYTKKIVQQHYGVPSEKIHVVHNGVDLVEFEPSQIKTLFPNDKVVLFVGRLTYQKGVDYFLAAAKQVLKHTPNTIFVIVGHGDMYKQLLLQAASLGIADRVIFPGFLKGEQLRACYQMADVFVMPSISEPYGIVALEAIATGTPAIISKQSGVSEAMNHVLKVNFWDTHKMAHYISATLQHPKLAHRLAKLALGEAQLLTWDKAAKETVSVYHSLIY